MIRPYLFLLALLAIFMVACTPKVTEKTTDTKPVTQPEPEPEETLSQCKNWNNVANEDDIKAAHVLYKDRLKEIRAERRKGAGASQRMIDSLYQVGYNYWTYAYAEAPAADGKRADHFEDGIRFYEYFLSRTTDATAKAAYVDTIMQLYDERAKCYGEEDYIMGRKAFDYYYKYPDMAEEMEKYEMFKKAIDMGGEKRPVFYPEPLYRLVVQPDHRRKDPDARSPGIPVEDPHGARQRFGQLQN